MRARARKHTRIHPTSGTSAHVAGRAHTQTDRYTLISVTTQYRQDTYHPRGVAGVLNFLGLTHDGEAEPLLLLFLESRGANPAVLVPARTTTNACAHTVRLSIHYEPQFSLFKSHETVCCLGQIFGTYIRICMSSPLVRKDMYTRCLLYTSPSPRDRG